MQLPRRDTVTKTSPTDPVLYHYQPIVRRFLLKRLEMVLALMGDARFNRLLDGGCGGGIFLPELARRCTSLYATDVHGRIPDVRAMAAANGVAVDVRQASLADTGFDTGFFDSVVVVSVLEFVPDLEAAVAEVYRILRKGGSLFVGYPGANPVVRFGYAAIRAPRSEDVHQSTFREIRAALARRFEVRREIGFPAVLPRDYALYLACHAVRV